MFGILRVSVCNVGSRAANALRRLSISNAAMHPVAVRRRRTEPTGGVHLVTSLYRSCCGAGFLSTEEFCIRLAMAIQGGVNCVHYSPETENPFDFGREVQQVCEEHGATFLVRNDVTLAVRMGADGVWLGANRLLSPLEARLVLGDSSFIGVSCEGWGALIAANNAARGLISAISFVPSVTQNDLTEAEIDYLINVVSTSEHPILLERVVLTPDMVRQLHEEDVNFDGVVASDQITLNPNPEVAAESFLAGVSL